MARKMSAETRAMVAWVAAIQERERARRAVRAARSEETRREAEARLVGAEVQVAQKRRRAQAQISA